MVGILIVGLFYGLAVISKHSNFRKYTYAHIVGCVTAEERQHG